MSWNRRARASKTKAAVNISAMATKQPSSPANSSTQAAIATSPDESAASKFTLKFRRDVWNTCTPTASSSPPHPESASSSPEPKARQIRKRKPSPVTTSFEPVTKAPKRSPVQRQCTVRLTRFHYGGPDRREGGKYRDMITLETPCLRSTCANCWTYRAHLMRSLPRPSTPDASTPARPSAWPIAVRNSDKGRDSAPAQEAQRSSVDAPSPPPSDAEEPRPKLTLILRFNSPVPEPERKYDILLPYSVLKHTSPTAASPKTTWREAPRQSYTARLRFSSDEAKARFKNVVHKQTRKELHLGRLGFHQMTQDAVVETLWKPQRRHRVRLVFESEAGREKLRRLIERYK